MVAFGERLAPLYHSPSQVLLLFLDFLKSLGSVFSFFDLCLWLLLLKIALSFMGNFILIL